MSLQSRVVDPDSCCIEDDAIIVEMELIDNFAERLVVYRFLR